MTLPQRDRVKEILDAVLDSPPALRFQHVVEACGGDDVVLAEVERLLACADKAHSLVLAPEFQAVDVLAAMAGIEFDPLPAGALLVRIPADADHRSWRMSIMIPTRCRS